MQTGIKQILTLFGAFFKIGAFTFGGGYAMIPLIQKEIVDKRKWITDGDILDIVAIAESTPGPIAINSATFVGQKIAGFYGALAATLGVVLPSFVVIAVIATVLREFQEIQAVQYAFRGVRAGVLALIAKAMVSMYRQCPKGWFSYLIMGASLIAVAFLNVSALAVVAGCAAAGVVVSMIGRSKHDLP